MGNSGGIINAPVSIEDVARTLGLGENDLALLITKAKSGGKEWLRPNGNKQMLAFDVRETGSELGNLIKGAIPYWNIYSNNSPGYWYLSIPDVKFNLMEYNNKYYFSLQCFDEYNHNSEVPMIENVSVRVLPGKHNIFIPFSLGSYDWKKINGATHCRLVEMIAGNETPFASNVIPLRIDGGGRALFERTVGQSENHTLAIALCEADGNSLTHLQPRGSLSIGIAAYTSVTLTASVPGGGGRGRRDRVYGDNSVIIDILRMANNNGSGKLRTVHTKSYNSNEEIVYDKERLPDPIDTQWLDFHDIGVGTKIPVRAYIPSEAWTGLTSMDCNIQIFMDYE